MRYPTSDNKFKRTFTSDRVRLAEEDSKGRRKNRKGKSKIQGIEKATKQLENE